MTETQKRIRAYKRALPHMRERVTAVLLLLVMSISMLTSATFAWITLSSSPEVSGLGTTIATNGNLEIALSDTDGLQPDESEVGDSGKNVALSNLTWGNLINLSDSSYGLDSLVLRPATLNTRDLINSPMSAVNYGSDGRVTNYVTDFAFTNYEKDKNTFTVPDSTQYGVRAVSSVTYKDITGNAFLVTQLDTINRDFNTAQGQFQAIYQNDSYMNTVGSLVGVHVGYVLGDGEDVSVSSTDMDYLVSIMKDFRTCMENIGKIIVEMMNLHQYLALTDGDVYSAYTFEDIFMVNYDGSSTFSSSNLNNTVLNNYKDRIPSIETFRTAWVKTVNSYNGIMKANENSVVYWKEHLMSSVNLLCDMNTATLDGDTAAEMQADMINKALAIITSSATDHVAVIHEGALKAADQLIDGNLNVAAGKVSITVVVPQSIKDKISEQLGSFGAALVPDTLTLKPEIYTAATPPALLDTDYKTANQAASGGSNLKGQPIAADTYAMAIDFWLRTNVQNSLLILEGDIQTTEVTLVDAEGNAVLDDNGNEMTETVVIGYSGVNRVWDELDDEDSEASLMIPEGGTSLTQGSGSCYIFYSDDPEQQAQSKNMLRAMRVAFVDENGNLLVQAYMDVDSAVEDSGRVIVPLKLREQSEVVLADGSILVDENGNAITRYIQLMPQNEAQRITAIIYLDGSILTNSEVLEAGTIKGQLNIQFGTTEMSMKALDDADLMESYYTITFAERDFDLGAYVAGSSKIQLKMMIEGTQPTTVKGNFLSIINSTQGARQPEFTMTQGSDGYWTAEVEFTGPGNFELRSIQFDGVDIALTSDSIVSVTIDGIAVNSLTCTGEWPTGAKSHSVLTAESYYQQEMLLNLASSDTHSVRGVFIGENGQNVSVNFSYQGDGFYRGSAYFNASSTYKMTYLEIDGVITPLDESLYKTITLQLGLRASVTIGTPTLVSGETNEDVLKDVTYTANSGWSFIYTCEEPLTMTVRCIITDDQGRKLENLEGLKLFYGLGNSNANLLDTNLEWVVTSGCYEGEFLFQRSGIYGFRYVQVDTTNFISNATSAPTITSIPPTPMEYVQQPEYAALTYDLGAASRDLSITLKNASAASLDIELTNGSGDVVTQTVTGSTNEATGITTFTAQAPTDGQWTVTGAYANTVFYDGVFYGGTSIDPDTGETIDNRLNLAELTEAEEIPNGEIASCFLTEVNVTVTGAPSSKTLDFMTDNKVESMTINVSVNIYDQSKPLATVLSELSAAFPDEGIKTNVDVSMTFDFTKHEYYSYTASTDVPESTMVRTPTANASGVYVLDAMNFKLAGDYTPDLSIKIGDTVYSEANQNLSKLTVQDVLKSSSGKFAVTWNLPEVQFTATNPAVNTSFNADISGKKTVMNKITNNNHSLEAYFQIASGDGTTCSPFTYTPSTATAQLTKAGTSFSSATLTIDGTNSDMVYNFTANGESAVANVGSTNIGGYQRSTVGSASASTIVMTYNNVNYTVNLLYTLSVTNTN